MDSRPPINGAELKLKTNHICPACAETMNRYEIFGMDIEACPQCRGLFLDKNELRALKDKCTKGTWLTLRWMDDEVEAIEKSKATLSKHLCPKCPEVKLISTHFGESNNILDWCPHCHGVWLEGGQFQQILQYMNDKLMTLTSEDMKSKVYEEIKEVWTGPESKIAEILDAKAALSALINITIFEHPKLAGFLINFSNNNPIR